MRALTLQYSRKTVQYRADDIGDLFHSLLFVVLAALGFGWFSVFLSLKALEVQRLFLCSVILPPGNGTCAL